MLASLPLSPLKWFWKIQVETTERNKTRDSWNTEIGKRSQGQAKSSALTKALTEHISQKVPSVFLALKA
jgi:hypothetical protein